MSLPGIVALLELSVSEEEIAYIEVDHPSSKTTSILLSVNYKEINEKPNTFNIADYKDTWLYDNMRRISKDKQIDFDDVLIQTYFVTYHNKFGFASTLPIYLIIGSNDGTKFMLVYSILPEYIRLRAD